MLWTYDGYLNLEILKDQLFDSHLEEVYETFDVSWRCLGRCYTYDIWLHPEILKHTHLGVYSSIHASSDQPHVATKEALQEFGPLVFATGATFQPKTSLYTPRKTNMEPPPQNRWFVDFSPFPKGAFSGSSR